MVLMGYGLVQGAGGQWQALDPLTVSICKQYPNRILPFVSTMYQAWHNQDEGMLSFAESQLATGFFKGIGEVMLRYFANTQHNEPEVNTPADSPFIKKLELRLVWAHMGSTERVPVKSRIGEIMERHPNLYTDIAGIQPMSLSPSGGARRATITDNKGKLLPEFKKILQDHNDRVLFGLDTPWQENWAEEPFKKWTEWAENVAAQLEVAGATERIMHKNAQELFKI
jgi:hypothetical protein